MVGNGAGGYSGDGGPAISCELYSPQGLYVNAAGNTFYIADFSNNVVRKVNSSGIISTMAGNGIAGFTGDGGQATAATLNGTMGITVNASGVVYISDYNNNRIRVVNTNGIISTFAGNGNASFSGDGGQATAAAMNGPGLIATDPSGNVYEAEFSSSRMRVITTNGIINTMAGNGTAGYSGDGGPATNASINNPSCVAIGPGYKVYIADFKNNCIRSLVSPLAVNVIETEEGNQLKLYPNPNNGLFNLSISHAELVSASHPTVEIYNMLGEKVYSSQYSIPIAIGTNFQYEIDVNCQPSGVYFLKLTAGNTVQTVRFIKQ